MDVPGAEGTRLRLADVLRTYRAEMAGARSARYVEQVASLVEDLAEHAGAAALEDITREHVVAFKAFLADGGRRGRKAGPKTVTNALASLSAFFAWARRAELFAGADPVESVDPPRRIRRRQMRAFTGAEVAALLAVAPPDRSRLYRFLAVTGMRIGQAWEVRGGWLSLGGDAPRVSYTDTKTGAERVAALDEQTAAGLREWYAAAGEQRDLEYPFRTEETLHRAGRRLRRDCRAAGIDMQDARGRGVGFHCFRRFVASTIARNRIDPRTAQQQLGHASVTTTLTYYTDAALEQQRTAVNAVAATLCAVDNPCRSPSCDGAQQDSAQVGLDTGPKEAQTESAESGHDTHSSPPARPLDSSGRSACGRIQHPPGPERPESDGHCSAPREGATEQPGREVGATGLEPVAPVRAPNPVAVVLGFSPRLERVLEALIDSLAGRRAERPCDGTTPEQWRRQRKRKRVPAERVDPGRTDGGPGRDARRSDGVLGGARGLHPDEREPGGAGRRP